MDWREIKFLDEMDECLVRVKGIEGTLLAISEADSEIGRETLVLLHWAANEARERLEKARSLWLERVAHEAQSVRTAPTRTSFPPFDGD